MLNFLKKINSIRLKRRNLKKLVRRESELIKFGPNAKAIYVKTKQGNFLVDPRDNFVAKKLLGSFAFPSGLKSEPQKVVSPPVKLPKSQSPFP